MPPLGWKMENLIACILLSCHLFSDFLLLLIIIVHLLLHLLAPFIISIGYTLVAPSYHLARKGMWTWWLWDGQMMMVINKRSRLESKDRQTQWAKWEVRWKKGVKEKKTGCFRSLEQTDCCPSCCWCRPFSFSFPMIIVLIWCEIRTHSDFWRESRFKRIPAPHLLLLIIIVISNWRLYCRSIQVHVCSFRSDFWSKS